MTRIDRTDQLLDALRQQLTARTESSGATATSSSGPDRAASASTSGGLDSLQRRLAGELREIDLRTPAGRRRARAAFIELVLAWDFGDALLRDNRLSSFVQSLDDTLCDDEATAARLDQLLAGLSRVEPR